ncbi:Dynein assembly factor 3, axonemal like protein [Habropoda laboriosa]|uniref:Dynein assembly factor 3, axonemal like protein n=1 Tax=Habropoda laboriosa TaxID=597456 RepID=A0A0L7R0F9_9HYME|nr:Dynein assembly factor 3, axonemal like protein [Habropoda laboriosa]
MWWGYSPALDIQSEVNKYETNCPGECLEVLIVGAGDARHILKTVASSYLHHDRIIIYNVVESTLEQVARSILLLSTSLDTNLGVFDWDYHMILKSRGVSNLTLQEYRFWRNNGIAFTWIEGESVRSNPTLLNNIIQHGPGFIHYTYLGDITNGPFFAWALQETKDNHMYRAADVAEQEVMCSIYAIRTKEPICKDLIGSHRDSCILNGTLVVETPNKEMEQESWKTKRNKYKKDDISWTDIKNHKVIFHPMASLESFKYKEEYVNRFDFIWTAHNTVKQLPNLVPLLKKGGIVLVELQKYLVESREENLQCFLQELKSVAQANGLCEINDINAKEHCIARFCK